jgi:nicotinate-nucleotide--dimethylbenzimidazole phosphoribosyltransferase
MNLLTKTIDSIKPLDKAAMDAARERQDMLTKPAGSLGRLEELSVRMAGIQGQARPAIEKKAMITMAGDHGVVAEKVGNWPQEVTAQMVETFLRGGAGINALARLAGARIVFVDIVGTGDMGIGNTTASSAIFAAMTGLPPEKVTGRGTGLTDEQLAHKTDCIRRALERNRPDKTKPVAVLAKVGGFEIGGLAGVMLGAAARRVPVVIDGFISGAAALIALGLAPQLKDYLIAGHVSAEAGHAAMLKYMGLEPLLSLEMRLGEGTGAALGIIIAEAAVRTLNEMATFAEAGVSEGEGAG